ncbi:PQQ-binding-like beta-propeller repeat protein [Cellulomonas sp. H30R-01]|uniref:outer membrane protein assembly factor BamB family protein n=1 Tax=Cellulomonas sp. H30R-01 TaxID=2704467 RepID=UPI00138B7600|nr:PQQ-binding-like beta-propeller repeat protein [Cellulomonas sp. H30R-01]QHT57627.1 PQQ-binding-like beta-propeller repeat protein [Cellulomonas sp. H30R-01]
MARDGGLRPVELEEHDGDPGPPSTPPHDGDDPPEGRTGRPGTRRGARRSAVLVGAAVVAALLVLGGVQVVLDRRAAAVDARIAALPGASVDVGTALTALWEVPPDVLWYPMLTRGTVAIGPAVLDDGAHGVAARDLRTGRVAWSVPIGPPVETQVDGWTGSLTCAPPPARLADPNHVPDVLVCHTTDVRPDAPGTAPGAESWSRVVAVDLRTHTVRSSVDVARAPAAAVLGDVVALGRLDGGRHVEVVAVDTATGAERWRYRDPQPLPAYADDSSSVSLGGAGDHVLVFGASGESYALAGDGTRIDGFRADLGWIDAGWLAVPADDGTRRVLRPGEPDLVVQGALARRTLDDGSAPGLEVSTTGSRTWGWDAKTGEQRWESEVDASSPSEQTVVVAEGRVHTTATSGVRTLDARTGALLWSYDLPAGVVRTGVMCDGPHVSVVSSTEDELALVVLDRRTGELVRTIPLPGHVEWAYPLGPYVLAASGDRATVLG